MCHHTDVGGRVAGSNASDSTEIYAEGLRIAPMKLYDKGVLNKTITTFIEKNVRVPVMVMGDLRAQLAACHIAEKQFADLVAQLRTRADQALSQRDHRLFRAPDPRRAARASRWRMELRGLDR